MKTLRIILLLVLGISVFSCGTSPKQDASDQTENELKSQDKDSKDTFQVRTNYYPDGKTIKEKIEIIKVKKDGKDVWIRNGKTITYYKNGNLQAESIYVNGKRQGLEKQYYEDGQTIYFERPFVNSKKEGIVKKYYRSGRLQSEAPYKQEMLGMGSQDYADDAENTKLTMPELKVWAVDKRREKGTYVVNAKVVDKFDRTVSRVEFTEGILLQADGRKYEHPGLKKLTEKNNIATITYYESTGFPTYVSVNARVTTNKGTPLLLNYVLTVN